MPYAKGDGPSVVIALGGNALGNSPQEQLDAGEEHRQAHRRHGRRWRQRRRLPRQRPPGRHDQQCLRLRRRQRRQDPGDAFPRGRRHVPGLHRLPAVPGHPERPEGPRHRCARSPTSSPRPSSNADDPGVPEPHQARRRLHGPRKTAKAKAAETGMVLQGGRRPRLASGRRLPEARAHRRVRRRAAT